MQYGLFEVDEKTGDKRLLVGSQDIWELKELGLSRAKELGVEEVSWLDVSLPMTGDTKFQVNRFSLDLDSEKSVALLIEPHSERDGNVS